MKRKKPKYRDKRFNLNTLEVNAIETSNVLGVHAPVQVNFEELGEKDELNTRSNLQGEQDD